MTMTEADRELLGWAAKAYGIAIGFCGDDVYCENSSESLWNPLKDDGDALRVAAKLGIWFMTANVGKPNGYSCAEYDDLGYTELHKNHPDIYVATRRAIVRMAARIGKGIDPIEFKATPYESTPI